MSIQQIAMIRADDAADVSVTGTARGEFGELLRSYRQSAALTQKELAHLAQLSPRAIWDLECGRRQRPQRSTVDGLIRALPLDDTQAWQLAAAARWALDRAAEQAAQEADGAYAELAAPAQLPHGAPAFTGRELARLDELAKAEPRGSSPVICLIDGPPGAGKTTLALRFAHRVADQYADGQLYANLRGFAHGQTPLPPQDARGRMLQDLDVMPSRVPAGSDARRHVPHCLGAQAHAHRLGQRCIRLPGTAAAAWPSLVPGPGHQPQPAPGPDRPRRRRAHHPRHPRACRLTGLLARIAGRDRIDADLPAAAAVSVGTTAARRLLDQLASAHLLEESGHGHYVFHDLLRLYAAEQASTENADGDRACAVSREGWQ